MRETLKVSQPSRSKRLIEKAARKVWQDATEESRRTAVLRARAKGIFTDEEVFRLIS